MKNLVNEYWPLALVGAAFALPAVMELIAGEPKAATPDTAVAVVDGEALQPTSELLAAIGGYPGTVAGVRIDKSRSALSDFWPQVRKVLRATLGPAGAGTRATQPKIDVDQAADIVSAAVQAARAGFAAANYAGDWAPLSDDVALMFRQIELVRFQNGGVADIENDSLSVLGNAYKQAVSAQAILSRASWSGDELSDLMIQNCTDAAQRLCEELDDIAYRFPISWPSVVDSLGTAITDLPATLGNVAGKAGDVIADIAASAVGSVVFSTPVLAAGLAYAWWKVA